MTTDALTITDRMIDEQSAVFAEDLPDHAGQIDRYAAAGLTRPQAFSLEAHAAKIISSGRRTILEIGRELLSAREIAQYGTWGPFLARCGLEERTAQNYMNVARQFGDKPEMISALPATALYALAAPTADPVVVGEIVTEVRAGAAPTVAEVKQRLTPAPAADMPHLPADFRTQQRRAERLGLHLDMDAHGRFSCRNAGGSGVMHYTWEQIKTHLGNQERAAAERAAEQARRSAPPTLAPRPAPTPTPPADEEIATAAPPAPAPPPVVLTPLAPAPTPTPGGVDLQAHKALVAQRALLAGTLALIDAELAGRMGPTIVVQQSHVDAAARLFLANPAFKAAAAMLAFSAVVEGEGS